MKQITNNKPLKIAVLVALFFATIFMLQAQELLSPPSAIVGAIPGEIDVSPMGAATYTIPIEVVPGTQSVQPNLSLVYNSLSGMGILGMKWSLAGLSAITRCGQIPYYDNTIEALQLNFYDRFALDGARLLQVSNGAYGGNEIQYATEVENFTRVVSYGGGRIGPPEYFRAFTDDGTIIEYGYENNSKQQLDNSDPHTTLNWFVNKITDANGNYMSFYYESYNSEIWIDEIHYTTNPNSTFTQPYAKVKFDYGTTSLLIQNTGFIRGLALSPQSKILKSITVSYKDTIVRKYEFNYNTNVPNERTPHLTEIILKGADNTPLRATTITWGDNYSSIVQPQEITGLPANFPVGKILPGDFNGDGYTDFVVYDIGSEATKSWKLYQFNPSNKMYEPKSGSIYTTKYDDALFFAQNITGEGKDNLIIGMKMYNSIQNTYYHEFNLFSPDVNSVVVSTFKFDDYNGITFGDFDGNGITDIMFIRVSSDELRGGKTVYWCLSFYSKYGGGMNPIYFETNETVPYIQIVNVSGNGKSAIRVTYITVKGKSKRVIYELGESGFVGKDFDSDSPFNYNPELTFNGDVNGDGIKDILACHSCADTPYWELFILKGDGTYIQNDLGTALDANLFESPYCTSINQVRFADLNGDGKEDIIQGVYSSGSSSKFHILLSKKYENEQYQCSPIMLSYIPGKYNTLENWTIGDINGDGLPDIILLDNADLALPIRYISFNQDNDYEFVKKITDGLGKTIQLDYKHQYYSGRSSHYENDPPVGRSAFMKFFLSVVDAVRISNGIGNGVNTLKYKFSTPIYSLPKRTLLGFNEVVCINVQENKKDSLTFSYGKMYNLWNQILLPYRKNSFVGDIETSITQYPTIVEYLDNNTRFICRSDLSEYNELTNTYSETNNVYNNQGRIISTTAGKYEGATPNPTKRLILETTTCQYKGICFEEKFQRKTVPARIISVQQYGNGPAITDTTTYSYGELGRLASVRKGNSDGSITTSYDNYLPSGLCQLKTISAQGCTPRTETYIYDATQRFTTSIKNVLNHETTFTFDAKSGNKKTETDPNGLITQYDYDAFGNLKHVLYPDNTETNTSVSWYLGNSIPNVKYSVITQTTAQPGVNTYYDLLGREVCRLDDGYYYDTQYNAKGEVYRVSYPYKKLGATDKIWSTYTYDAYGRKLTETAPYTNLSYSYSNNNKTVTTTRNGVVSSKTCDALGRIEEATDEGGTITYKYAVVNVNGKTRHKTTIAVTGGGTTTILTDLWGNRLSIIDPNAGEITSTYNKLNELETQTDANGNVTTYQYDALGRVKKKIFTATDNSSQTINYLYDFARKGIGKIYTITTNNVFEKFSYDHLSRISESQKAVDNVAHTLNYNYNNNGQLSQLIYDHGFAVNYSYTSSGKLNEIRRADKSNTLIYRVNTRNKYNQPTDCEYGNGVVTYRTYNDFGLLTRIQTGNKVFEVVHGENPGGLEESRPNGYSTGEYEVDSAILNYRYAYNDKGLMSSRSESVIDRLEKFTYDDLDRLKSATSGTMKKPAPPSLLSYALNGNITYHPNVGSYIYDSNKPHAVTQIEPLNNSIISSNQNTVTYNYFNQPTQITEGSYQLDLYYNANQQRYKMTQKRGEKLISTQYYLNKYHERIIEHNTGTTYSYDYIYGDNGVVALHITRWLSGVEATDSMYYIHTDHLGSYCAITNANKQVRQRNYFDPWGNCCELTRGISPPQDSLIVVSISFTNFPLIARGFTGHEHYPYLKIINMNGRLYDPVIGRFFSPDKYVANSSFTQDFNRYTYARNNPLMYTDPSGEFIWALVPVFAWLGGMMNMYMNRDNAANLGQALGYFGIGALASGASAAAGAAVGAALGVGTSIGFGAGFGASFTAGFAGGFTGAFITGAGNAWMQGANFGEGIGLGFKSGMISGMISGFTAGIMGGIQGAKTKGIFDSGCEQLGINPWDPIPEELRTDAFLEQANDVWFQDGPDAYHKVDYKNVYTLGRLGRILPDGYTGKPTIYYHYEKAFRTPLQLFSTMGHELVHASQLAALGAAGASLNLLEKPDFIDMLDYYARIYVNTAGGIHQNPGALIDKYAKFHEIVDYTNFSWTKNKYRFVYPF